MKKYLCAVVAVAMMFSVLGSMSIAYGAEDSFVESVDTVLSTDTGLDVSQLEKGTYKVEAMDKEQLGSIMVLDENGDVVRFAMATESYYGYIFIDSAEDASYIVENITLEKISDEEIEGLGCCESYTEKAVEDYTEEELELFFA